MTKTEHTRVIWWLELVLKLGMLTVGFLQVSSLTFGKPIISIVLWPTLGLGGILLLYRLWHWKEYAVSANIWILVLFCISYAVSSIANLQYGWYSNLRTWVWMVFLMFLFIFLFQIYAFFLFYSFTRLYSSMDLLMESAMFFTAASTSSFPLSMLSISDSTVALASGNTLNSAPT